MVKLTPKQIIFCQEYAKNSNRYQAACAAGYSKATAPQQASRLLSKVKIKAEIEKLLSESKQEAKIELTSIMNELKSVIFANMSNYTDWSKKTVQLKEKKNLTEEQLKAIESVSESKAADGTKLVKIKLHSKLRAAEIMVKLFELTEHEERIKKLEEAIKIGGNKI